MGKDTQQDLQQGFHPVIRVTTGFTALFMLFTSIDKANSSVFGFIICFTSLFALLASLTKGKVGQFFGSCFGIMVGIISIYYLYVTIHEVWQGDSISSIFEPIMFSCTFGLLGVGYAIDTQFGFSEDNSTSNTINWYKVTFDGEHIYRDVTPPSYRDWRKLFKKTHTDPWRDSTKWVDIEQICFIANDLDDSDGIVIRVVASDNCIVIPTESDGGNELWMEILERNLFDEKLAVEAMASLGGIFCTPEIEEKLD